MQLTRRPYIQWTTPTSAYIVWQTAQPSSSFVEYVAAGDPSNISPTPVKLVGTLKVKRHVMQLKPLRPGSTYRYRVGSANTALAQGTFQTAKLAGEPFSFAVWGDSGVGGAGQKALAAQIERQRPDFLVHTGDLIYNRGEAKKFDPYFFRIYAPTLARVPFYGSLGNHDVGTANGQPFLDNFIFPRNGPRGLAPERNYAFDYGDAHFVVIDSNLSAAQLRQHIVPWLESDLSRSRALWKFAVFHHPPYSSGLHGDEPRTQRVLAPVFSRLKVDIVLNGHDHDYERFKPINGVVYIVTGAGGAGRYPRRQTRPETARYWNGDWSFTRLSIAGRKLRGQQISTSGTIIDDWSMTK